MTDTTERALAPRVGTVGIYATGSRLDVVRQARALTGRVTLGGASGKRALAALAAARDLYGVDLDPADYMQRTKVSAQIELFEVDWEARQRDLGLDVVRSNGVHVGRKDQRCLRHAFTTPVSSGTVRVVSIEDWWLRDGLPDLLAHIRACDDSLAFVLANCFDPLDEVGAVDGLRALLDTTRSGGRRVELLRADVTAIGFAATGGSFGTIGTSTATRHHGLPLSNRAAREREVRLRSAYVFVPALLSWHRGTELGALSQFDGAGITGCDCSLCDGRDLMRFTGEWNDKVPTAISDEAHAHDLHSCVALTRRILASPDPAAAWIEACQSAVATAAGVASVYKVRLTVPASISAWR